MIESVERLEFRCGAGWAWSSRHLCRAVAATCLMAVGLGSRPACCNQAVRDLVANWGQQANEVRAASHFGTDVWAASLGAFLWIKDVAYLEDGQAWAVGSHIVYFDGDTWASIDASPDARRYTGISMSSAADGWIVGNEGALVKRFNGQWIETNVGQQFDFEAIATTADMTSWVVGMDTTKRSGVIFYNQGLDWNQVHTQDMPALNDIDMSSPESGWIVGNRGQILRYDGGQWTAMTVSPESNWYGVADTLGAGAWFVGGELPDGESGQGRRTILRFDGRQWTTAVSERGYPFTGITLCKIECATAQYQALAVAGATVWALGRSGQWYEVGNADPQRAGITLLTVQPAAAADRYVVAGSDSTIAYVTPDGIQLIHDDQHLSGVLLQEDGQAWSVGRGTTPLLYDGNRWTRQDSPAFTRGFLDIDGQAAGDCWAVGVGGSAGHLHDGRWSEEDSGTTFDLKKVRVTSWGDIWAVGSTTNFAAGDGSVVLVRTAGRWETRYQRTGPGGALQDLDALEKNNIWAVGWGVIVHGDGRSWTEESVPYNLFAIDMIAANEGWAGGSGVLLHYDGLRWRKVLDRGTTPSLQNADIYSIAMENAEEGWAAGLQGVILRYSEGVWSFSRTRRDVYGGDGAPYYLFEITSRRIDGVRTEVWAAGAPRSMLVRREADAMTATPAIVTATLAPPTSTPTPSQTAIPTPRALSLPFCSKE
jgi:hypothetical protein